MRGSQFSKSRILPVLGLSVMMSACSMHGFQYQRPAPQKAPERSPYTAVPRVVMTPVAPKPKEESLGTVATNLGMSVKIDMKQGHRFLIKKHDRIVIMPGKKLALVNGARVAIPSPVMWNKGVLVAPDGLQGTLANALEMHPARRPTVVWKPVSVKKPTPTVVKASSQRPTSYPRANVKMPRGWDIKTNRRWTHIVIHHSATTVGGAKSFHRAHKRKWRWGLGYHFVVGNGSETGVGEVEVGVRWFLQNKGVHGAHAGIKKYNQQGIGVCMVGNFQNGQPTTKQLAALAGLCRKLMKRHGIPKSHVIGHKEARPKHTECPGKNFPWRKFRSML